MQPIRKILIIGGGSSGWMTAAILNRRLPRTDITLIEASDIPTIGVGESTNPVIKYFHNIVGIDETDFLRASNGAFKIAIRFEHFNHRDGIFMHPFGQPKLGDEVLFRPGAQTHHLSFHLAMTTNMFTKECVHAYQIDAGLYGQYLKEVCKRRGVHHVVDRVEQAVLTEHGEIARIDTGVSGRLEADLYIDCSGFRALLLDQTLHEPFYSATDCLLNNRAIAARVPYVDKTRELTTYTNCIALSAGWVWQIPLWSRLGTGYVYSDAFLTPTEAEAEYRTFLNVDRVKDLAFNHITIRAGRHDRAWVGNCVGIGVSYGFLEPLESTGLSLTQVALIDLARVLVNGVTPEAREGFNSRQAGIFDTTKDFIVSHFALTTRDDTPYWRHIRHTMTVPDRLAEVLRHARARSYEPIEHLPHTFYDKLNWNLILSGMGLFDDQSPAAATEIDMPHTALHAQVLQDTVFGDTYSIPDEGRMRDDAFASAAAHPMWFPTW